MSTRMSMTLAAALTIAATPAAGAAAANAKDSITCARQGHVTISPGLTMSPKDFTFDELGTFGPCFGPGGKSPLTGTVTVTRGDRTRGHGSCTGAQFKVPFTVAWNDGTTSKGNAAGTVAPPFVFAGGQITEGTFAGHSYTTELIVIPQHPELCASTGVTEIDYYGEIVS